MIIEQASSKGITNKLLLIKRTRAVIPQSNHARMKSIMRL